MTELTAEMARKMMPDFEKRLSRAKEQVLRSIEKLAQSGKIETIIYCREFRDPEITFEELKQIGSEFSDLGFHVIPEKIGIVDDCLVVSWDDRKLVRKHPEFRFGPLIPEDWGTETPKSPVLPLRQPSLWERFEDWLNGL